MSFSIINKMINKILLIKITSYVVYLILSIFAISLLFQTISSNSQEDFHCYYYGAKAYQSGLNPYLLNNLMKVSENNYTSNNRFLYPTYIIYIFYPFTILSLNIAIIIFAIIKFLSFIVLL